MRVIAVIEQPEIVAAILGSLGLESRAPPAAPARQGELFCDLDFERAAWPLESPRLRGQIVGSGVRFSTDQGRCRTLLAGTPG